MALSGTIEGSIHSGHYTLRISWSATQNISNNTSTITAKMYLVLDPSWSLNIKTRSNACSIAGVSTAFTSPAISSGGGSTILLGTVSNTVSHASDGTRNVAIGATFNIQATIAGTWYESISASATVTLDTIARVSSFTLSSSEIILGNTLSITINRLSSSFTHRIRYIWGKQSGTIATGVTTSYQWTVPLELAREIPHGASGTGSVIVETMNGSTLIGSSTKNFTGTVPTNIVPSISSVAITDASGAVPESIGVYVKGKSTLKVLTDAYGSYGSTISSYRVQVNGRSYSGNDVTTGVIDTSGTLSVVATVTDTRGRTASLSKNITVYDYHTPIISTFDVKRVDADGNDADEGEYARVSYTTMLAPVNGKNTGSMAIYYKASNEVNWIQAVLEEGIAYALSDSFTISGVSIDSTYEVRIDLADGFTGSSRSAQLPTAAVVLDFLADGTGLGVGKVAEFQNTLDVAWSARFRREVVADGGFTTMGNRVFPSIGLTVHRNASNQNLTASDTYEVVKWTHSTSVGSGLSLNSSGGIVIGEGVSVVRVSGQIAFGAQVNGMKVGAIWTSTSSAHLSRSQAYVSTANPQTINFAPKLVSVSQGNVLTVRVYGASGDVIYGGTMQSYFTVEAVG